MNCDIKDYDSMNTFGALKAGTKVNEAQALFARIDSEKMLAEIAQKQQEAAKKEEAAKPKKLKDLHKSRLTILQRLNFALQKSLNASR